MANLITNPDFEVNTTGWSVSGTGTIARSGAQFHAGAWSLRCDVLLLDEGALYAQQTVTTSTSYTLSAWFRTDSAEQVGIGWNEFQSDGTTYLRTTQSQQYLSATTWTQVSHTVTTLANGAKVNPFFSIRNTAVDFYLDDASLDFTTGGGEPTRLEQEVFVHFPPRPKPTKTWASFYIKPITTDAGSPPPTPVPDEGLTLTPKTAGSDLILTPKEAN